MFDDTHNEEPQGYLSKYLAPVRCPSIVLVLALVPRNDRDCNDLSSFPLRADERFSPAFSWLELETTRLMGAATGREAADRNARSGLNYCLLAHPISFLARVSRYERQDYCTIRFGVSYQATRHQRCHPFAIYYPAVSAIHGFFIFSRCNGY